MLVGEEEEEEAGNNSSSFNNCDEGEKGLPGAAVPAGGLSPGSLTHSCCPGQFFRKRARESLTCLLHTLSL